MKKRATLKPIANLLPEKMEFLTDLVAQLSQVPGVLAVVLGGSYTRGTQHGASDLDLGLYYREERAFDVDAIRAITQRASDNDSPIVTDFYAWGQWVNGGGWIQTTVGKLDFLYRNLDQVGRTIAEAEQGIVHHDYGQQPAYGFYQCHLPGRDEDLCALVRPGWADLESHFGQPAQGIPVPISLAAPDPTHPPHYSLHYSIVTGIDLGGDRVYVSNTYGYEEAYSVADFLDALKFNKDANKPLLL